MLQLSLVNFSKNSYLIVEGKPNSDRFYIIRTGTVTCVRSRPGVAPIRLGPGDFVGVVPCMSGHSMPFRLCFESMDIQENVKYLDIQW